MSNLQDNVANLKSRLKETEVEARRLKSERRDLRPSGAAAGCQVTTFNGLLLTDFTIVYVLFLGI